ncbi:SurA N-terminal domain-containing protein [Bradyrhizobium sp. LHD-71]|uniref:peptidylprolyl isomerase n=1 Tax=Bradyrhizobium sp. LHD-71 TaxID=3072141 RepID=UPI00280CDE71|nr:SurA N-terminal domain-containing protein [Bradyrhizobium sp. LHD-71]MDQ8728783.1 SurA N-terminal domain-containing protein [Bradyrhizobium sp. LHD-71]
MLRGIRTASSGWLGKTIMASVMGVLIFSFAIWGVADVFRGFGQSTVAKVGDSEISIDQFRQLYNERLQMIGRQIGRPMSSAQARAFGLDQQVLQQWLADSVMDEAARRMGLGQSDAEIVRLIHSDPTFAGVNGKFDPQRFAQLIRQVGYNEQRYIAEQRKLSVRRQIATTISSGVEPPKALLDALLRYRDELRSIDYVQLGPAQAGNVGEPSPEALASYFDERKALFRAPEFRKVAVVVLTPQDQAKWTEVSDDEARKVFEASKAKYETAEKRHVLQMVFPTAEEANAARAKLTSGTSFEQLAKERGLSTSDYDLGTVTKSGILDPAVAEAAFALPENEISQPVVGRFGVVLTKVTKIETGVAASFDKVAQSIKNEIALERARATVRDVYNKMEDERGGGASVIEAAKKVGLPVTTIEAMDRSGRAPDGKPVPGLPPTLDIVTPVFTADVGSDNDPLQINRGPSDSGYVWYDVLNVTPSRDRTLDEVKDRVIARWRDNEIEKRLRAKSDEMVEQLQKGRKLAELAQAAGLKVETAASFKRGANVPGMSANGVEAVFAANKGDAGQSDGAQAGQRVVYVVTDIVEPKVDLTSAEIKALRDNVQRTQAEEQVNQFVQRLERDFGTQVNEAALAQATGAQAAN